MAHIRCLMGGVTDRTGILPKPAPADMAMARWPEACVRKRTGRKVRCSGLLKGLHRLLRRLDQKLRHRVLSQRFTEAQRQTFERWMLSRPDSHSRDRDRRVKVTQVTKIRARKAQKVSLAAAFRRKAGLAHLHGLVVHPRLKSAAVRYSAEVTIDRLRLLTKEHHCLEVVQGFRSALVDMKKRMEGVGQAAFEARFREVLAACLAEHQLQPRAMGLRFCVLLGSLWLPRPWTQGFALGAALERPVAECCGVARCWRFRVPTRLLPPGRACVAPTWTLWQQAVLATNERPLRPQPDCKSWRQRKQANEKGSWNAGIVDEWRKKRPRNVAIHELVPMRS